ncbi:MAG: insulinase family protein [Treponema sp.]|nr:insulinase family protein [Treponema sp.]
MEKFDFLNPANIGKEYKDFILLKIEDVPDYKCKSVFLRHKRTGLEVFHLIKNDHENLFAFAFRTAAKDSKGAAHILEHSALCSSEKFPLKEPFSTLAGQSIATFLNAMTYPDKTVYPAASLVRKDYFNMFDVYADCVFFPKLSHDTFIQEGHRMELDQEGKMSIQGVVYNEMKANFTTFYQIANKEMVAAMFPDSYPAFSSGGDPAEIPYLTYEEFLAFHKTFYSPDNCCLFLYGDIPTAEQLDFIDEKYMARLEEKFNCKEVLPYANEPLPHVKPEVKELLQLKKLDKSVLIEKDAPLQGATGSLVCLATYSGQADMEKYFIGEVICGNDSSPLLKAIKDSGLGDMPWTGNYGQFKEEFWVAGIGGVKPKNEKKVFAFFEKEIQKLYKNGVSQQDIDSAVMGIDFNLREENRWWGPYSIQLMEKSLKGWVWGDSCTSQLCPITKFEELKKKLYADKDYVKKLIKKYFIDPQVQCRIIVRPSKTYLEDLSKAEAELVAKLEKDTDKEQLKKDLDRLHEYQAHIETPEELACIPHTKVEELEKTVEEPKVELEFVKGADDSDVPLFVSKEETNGIFYVDVLFPFDRLSPEHFKHTPFLSNVMTNIGWEGKSWNDCIAESACIMGDVWGRILTGSVYDVPQCKELAQKYAQYNFCGRKWLGVSCKALTSKAEESFDLLARIITKMDFKDTARLKTLIQEQRAYKKAGIVNDGQNLAFKRCTAAWSEGYALAEILWGVTQLYTINEYKEKNAKKILKEFEYIYRESLKAGGVIHITADEESLAKLMPLIQKFAKAAGLTKLLPSNNYQLEDYLPYVVGAQNAMGEESKESLKTESQTGYATAVTPCSPYLTPQAASESVYTTWLNNHTFWDKFRTTGGCYGAGVYPDSGEGCLKLSTYRDPDPQKHAELLVQTIMSNEEMTFNHDDVEKSIVTCYGAAIEPQTPQDRGKQAFETFIYANNGFKQLKMDNLLAIKDKDVQDAAKRLAQMAQKEAHKVVFMDKSKDSYGKNLDLPL